MQWSNSTLIIQANVTNQAKDLTKMGTLKVLEGKKIERRKQNSNSPSTSSRVSSTQINDLKVKNKKQVKVEIEKEMDLPTTSARVLM